MDDYSDRWKAVWARDPTAAPSFHPCSHLHGSLAFERVIGALRFALEENAESPIYGAKPSDVIWYATYSGDLKAGLWAASLSGDHMISVYVTADLITSDYELVGTARSEWMFENSRDQLIALFSSPVGTTGNRNDTDAFRGWGYAGFKAVGVFRLAECDDEGRPIDHDRLSEQLTAAFPRFEEMIFGMIAYQYGPFDGSP